MYAITPKFSSLSRLPHVHRKPCSAALTSPRPPVTVSPGPPADGAHLRMIRPTNVSIADPSSLRSTWSHRAWVASGFATVLASLAKAAAAAVESGSPLEPLVAALLGYVLADLGSGVYHWGIDNYGGPSTPVFGSQIEAFQGHHRWPQTITRREFANNLHALARAVTFVVLPLEGLCDAAGVEGAAAHAFVGTCAGCIMLSQQFHAWAHEKKSRLPAAVAALQDAGLLVSRSMHAAHHRPPYSGNYCIVSGMWNGALDELKVFEALEMVLYFRFGMRPRSWSEPLSEWREAREEASDAAGGQGKRLVR